MIGHVAEQAVREFCTDNAFKGMFTVDIGCGFTNDYPPEILTDRAMLSVSPQVVVLADHSKFGRVSSILIAPVTAATIIIITETVTPPATVDQITELGIQVIQA